MSCTKRRISVAPMMDWTDRHDRFFLRQISKHSYLYTEMVTSGAVIHGDRSKLLGYHPQEHPIAVQLGGSDPVELSECAKVCEDLGYDEINLNVGCPSDRVQKGKIGACLMAEPELVAECVASMQRVVSIPVTVKCRIGIDDQDDYEDLHRFVSLVSAAGCKVFIIHARKAWLKGLSPKQNRDVPPLNYDIVYRIKQVFPDLEIIINGGITDIPQANEHLSKVDGVMIGREAYHNPYILSQVDAMFYQDNSTFRTRQQVLESMIPYAEEHLANGGKLQQVVRHMLGLFHAQPGGKLWRRHLSENAHKSGADETLLIEALGRMSRRPNAFFEF